ncbi:MAG: superoxide dismutase [candidate division Zixibacteria bacterium]|nr:superoxide dismutase [candidate division Zixibacteria bacterium]
MAHTLPELGYAYDALEPFIDAKTMEIHHSKHHQAYTNNFNAALEGQANLAAMPLDKLFADLNVVPENIRAAVRNNGGGFVNHALFWQLLKKDVAFAGPAADAIKAKFGGFDQFKDLFSKASVGRFGSGWGWLVVNNGELEIMSTPNQDTPLSEGKTPILTLDVWEHAYYLKYQNRRPDYVGAFFNVINWEKVNELYTAATR